MMLSQNALLTEAGEIHMKHEILKKQHRLPTVNMDFDIFPALIPC